MAVANLFDSKAASQGANITTRDRRASKPAQRRKQRKEAKRRTQPLAYVKREPHAVGAFVRCIRKYMDEGLKQSSNRVLGVVGPTTMTARGVYNYTSHHDRADAVMRTISGSIETIDDVYVLRDIADDLEYIAKSKRARGLAPLGDLADRARWRADRLDEWSSKKDVGTTKRVADEVDVGVDQRSDEEVDDSAVVRLLGIVKSQADQHEIRINHVLNRMDTMEAGNRSWVLEVSRLDGAVQRLADEREGASPRAIVGVGVVAFSLAVVGTLAGVYVADLISALTG